MFSKVVTTKYLKKKLKIFSGLRNLDVGLYSGRNDPCPSQHKKLKIIIK